METIVVSGKNEHCYQDKGYTTAQQPARALNPREQSTEKNAQQRHQNHTCSSDPRSHEYPLTICFSNFHNHCSKTTARSQAYSPGFEPENTWRIYDRVSLLEDFAVSCDWTTHTCPRPMKRRKSCNGASIGPNISKRAPRRPM